ncbi:MAG TPA: hypothetical protein VLH15_11500 [Dehalococcoidales bacterium]|nr:hypothetical protein [Dehalococcoidales bacterium]
MTAEKAGFPSVSIVSTGFLGQAQAVAQSLGIQNLSVAEYPGVIATDSEDDLKRKVTEVLINNIIKGITKSVVPVPKPREPEPTDIVFEGTLDEIQGYFYKRLWSDGLPIIPPTIDRIEKFLKYTNKPADQIIGYFLPENRQSTVWNIAVNGVMAGCKPEYMPVLIAIIEAIVDPEFRIQDAGSTPGWEPLIILNGPIIKELDFNYETGVMRVGRQANTTIGRFLRLYMRNIPGLRILPMSTDKATIGDTFNLVLPENEDVVAELGWEPYSVSRGFKRGENVVTVQSVVYTSPPIASGGDKALDHLDTWVEVMGSTASHWTHMAINWWKYYPVIVASPSIAHVIARDGLTKKDIGQYLYDKAKVSAGSVERLALQGGFTWFNLKRMVEEKQIPSIYCESSDPDRLIPVFIKPEWIGVVVSGDPGRNRSRGYIQNHEQGPPVSRLIELPDNWNQLLASNPK